MAEKHKDYKSEIINTARVAEKKAWDRYYLRERNSYIAIAEGLGMESASSRQVLTHVDDLSQNNKSFYDWKGEQYR